MNGIFSVLGLTLSVVLFSLIALGSSLQLIISK